VADPNARALPKGALFLTKSLLTDMYPLVEAILEIKQRPLSGKISSNIRRAQLTENQLAVLQSVAQGLTTKEIAGKLDVSEKAIEGTITRLHTILGLSKIKSLNPRVQLTRAYFELAGKKPPGV
jgi:DNA-binding NarL/FixJ family response regulator